MGIRVEADYADKNMNEKIKFFRTMKDPYILVIGDKEVETQTVSITVRGQKQQLHDVPLDTLYRMVRKMEEEHTLELIGSTDGI
jgi:threonyl-tRNA synthetase